MTDDPITEGRAKAEAFNGSGEGFKNVERLNAYQCERCDSYAVTIDREPGVTPFITMCGNCGGNAQSAMYRVGSHHLPTHEWVRPKPIEGLNAGTIDHIRNGGLIMRPINAVSPHWTAPKSRWA